MKFLTGLTGLLLLFKLELLLLVLNDEVAELPLESPPSDLTTKLESDFDDNLLIDGFTSCGIRFGDLIGERTAFEAPSIFIGDTTCACAPPICVVFTDFEF
jgi:hypothetical protein